MERTEISVKQRDPAVKARALRRAQRLPGVIYGGGGETISIEFDAAEFNRLGLASSGAHLIHLVSDHPAVNDGIALIRSVQNHPLSGAPVHVDLLRVDVHKPVETKVSIRLIGKAAGEVEGGIVQPLRREIDIRALPDKLPDTIEVDISELGVHDVLHIEDLTLPEGVESLHTENFSVVAVMPPTVEKVAAEEEEALEGEALEAAGEEAPEGEAPSGESAPEGEKSGE